MERLLEEETNTSGGYLHDQLKRFNRESNTYNNTLSKMSYAFLALGTTENILVCLVLFRASSHSTSKLSSFFILHLAITDLVFRAFNFFRKVSGKRVELNKTQCKMTIVSVYTCAAVTFALLAGIAIDRYVHIMFPIRSLSVKIRKCLIMLSIWIYSLAICSGFIASATVSHFILYDRRRPMHQAFLNKTRNNTYDWDLKEPRKHCIPGSPGSLERKIAYTIYFLFAFVVPLFCIAFSYTKITVFLWRKTKAANVVNRGLTRAKLRALRMFALVVFSFLLSWGPIMILDIIASYPRRPGKVTIEKIPLRPLFDCISQTSSILNPVIYAFGDTNFRRSLYLLFRVRKRARVRITRVSPTKMCVGTCIQMATLNARNALNPERSAGRGGDVGQCDGSIPKVNKRNVVFHEL